YKCYYRLAEGREFMFLLPGMNADEKKQQGHCCSRAEEPWSFCEEQTQLL
ncbi:hypothetical protein KUCAC02_004604, partial [Chaenocephalus aceratus]